MIRLARQAAFQRLVDPRIDAVTPEELIFLAWPLWRPSADSIVFAKPMVLRSVCYWLRKGRAFTGTNSDNCLTATGPKFAAGESKRRF